MRLCFARLVQPLLLVVLVLLEAIEVTAMTEMTEMTEESATGNELLVITR